MKNTGATTRAVGFVRAWLLLYTAGLPPGLRDSRREEIDADLWEQAKEAETGLSDGLPLATHLLLRWLLGLPDDLLWRLAHIRIRGIEAKEGAMIIVGAILGIIGGALVGLIVGVIVGGIVAIVSIIGGFELNEEYGASAGLWYGGFFGAIIGAGVGGIWGGKNKWSLDE